MATGSVFENNRTQAVRLPAEMRFPPGIKKVNVRVVGPDRVLSPVDRTWDTFFQEDEASADALLDRGEQGAPQERQPLQ
jgi:antitoxin VapB